MMAIASMTIRTTDVWVRTKRDILRPLENSWMCAMILAMTILPVLGMVKTKQVMKRRKKVKFDLLMLAFPSFWSDWLIIFRLFQSKAPYKNTGRP